MTATSFTTAASSKADEDVAAPPRTPTKLTKARQPPRRGRVMGMGLGNLTMGRRRERERERERNCGRSRSPPPSAAMRSMTPSPLTMNPVSVSTLPVLPVPVFPAPISATTHALTRSDNDDDDGDVVMLDSSARCSSLRLVLPPLTATTPTTTSPRRSPERSPERPTTALAPPSFHYPQRKRVLAPSTTSGTNRGSTPLSVVGGGDLANRPPLPASTRKVHVLDPALMEGKGGRHSGVGEDIENVVQVW